MHFAVFDGSRWTTAPDPGEANSQYRPNLRMVKAKGLTPTLQMEAGGELARCTSDAPGTSHTAASLGQILRLEMNMESKIKAGGFSIPSPEEAASAVFDSFPEVLKTLKSLIATAVNDGAKGGAVNGKLGASELGNAGISDPFESEFLLSTLGNGDMQLSAAELTQAQKDGLIELNMSGRVSLTASGKSQFDAWMNPTNAVTRMEGGKAVFENDNYRITAGDDNEVLIKNKKTGEAYRAWGDPHMEIDGKQAFDFWGKTTFDLEDGTKVTIETTPWGHNPDATLSSKVTITNGRYGAQISGVDTNSRGDLKVDERRGMGREVDAALDDGNVLYENSTGKGFVAKDEQGNLREVDQKYIWQSELAVAGITDHQENEFLRFTLGNRNGHAVQSELQAAQRDGLLDRAADGKLQLTEKGRAQFEKWLNPTNARASQENGNAVFENDNFRITAGDDNQVLIKNKKTGEAYRAWGDPHMEIDGKHAFDFYGTTTFGLEDGTKVTIETTPFKHNPRETLSSRVTITNGHYAVQISGVDTNTIGDLKINERKGKGREVDAAVVDGNVLLENQAGKGFVAKDERGVVRQVDQQHINKTDLLKGGKV